MVTSLFVGLGVLFLPDSSTTQICRFVQLHSCGDRELETEISPCDEAKDDASLAKNFAGVIAAGFLLFPSKNMMAASLMNLRP